MLEVFGFFYKFSLQLTFHFVLKKLLHEQLSVYRLCLTPTICNCTKLNICSPSTQFPKELPKPCQMLSYKSFRAFKREITCLYLLGCQFSHSRLDDNVGSSSHICARMWKLDKVIAVSLPLSGMCSSNQAPALSRLECSWSIFTSLPFSGSQFAFIYSNEYQL